MVLLVAVIGASLVSPWGFPWNIPLCLLAGWLAGARLGKQRTFF